MKSRLGPSDRRSQSGMSGGSALLLELGFWCLGFARSLRAHFQALTAPGSHGTDDYRNLGGLCPAMVLTSPEKYPITPLQAGSSLTAVGSTSGRYSTTFETGLCPCLRAAGRSRSC